MKNAILGTFLLLASTSLFGNDAEGETKFSCNTESVGIYEHFTSIQVSDDTLTTQAHGMNIRSIPVHTPIALAPIGEELPTEEPKLSCVYSPESTNGYSALIEVYEDSVVVKQSSTNGRYAPLKYNFVKEDEAVEEPAIEFSCNTDSVGIYQRYVSIAVSGDTLTTQVHAMNIRSIPVHTPIALAALGAKLPRGKPKYSCVFAPESDVGYSAIIEVYKNSVVVKQSSIHAKYAALRFDFVSESN